MRTWRVIAAIGMLSVLGACSHPPTTQSSSSTGTELPTAPAISATDTTAEPQPEPTESETTEPSLEPTTTETAQPTHKQPSVSIANAPVGGSPEQAGALQCVEVNWLNNPLPDGATVTIQAPKLENENVFKLDQSACDSFGGRPCDGVVWRSNDTQPCSVGARQFAEDGPDTKLLIPVNVTCTTQQICDDLKSSSTGSSIFFSAGDIQTSPSESPSQTSETPSETPTETPSGNG